MSIISRDICDNFDRHPEGHIAYPREMFASEAKWYVASIAAGRELSAEENLQRQGFPTFLPRFLKQRRAGSNRYEANVPVFPGYIFVSFDIERHNWLAINSTRGVRRLVGPAAAPTAVQSEVMHALMGRCSGEIMINIVSDIKYGDNVKINIGTLAGKIAIVSTLEANDRVRLLFDILGSSREISLPLSHISPANC